MALRALLVAGLAAAGAGAPAAAPAAPSAASATVSACASAEADNGACSLLQARTLSAAAAPAQKRQTPSECPASGVLTNVHLVGDLLALKDCTLANVSIQGDVLAHGQLTILDSHLKGSADVVAGGGPALIERSEITSGVSMTGAGDLVVRGDSRIGGVKMESSGKTHISHSVVTGGVECLDSKAVNLTEITAEGGITSVNCAGSIFLSGVQATQPVLVDAEFVRSSSVEVLAGSHLFSLATKGVGLVSVDQSSLGGLESNSSTGGVRVTDSRVDAAFTVRDSFGSVHIHNSAVGQAVLNGAFGDIVVDGGSTLRGAVLSGCSGNATVSDSRVLGPFRASNHVGFVSLSRSVIRGLGFLSVSHGVELQRVVAFGDTVFSHAGDVSVTASTLSRAALNVSMAMSVTMRSNSFVWVALTVEETMGRVVLERNARPTARIVGNGEVQLIAGDYPELDMSRNLGRVVMENARIGKFTCSGNGVPPQISESTVIRSGNKACS